VWIAREGLGKRERVIYNMGVQERRYFKIRPGEANATLGLENKIPLTYNPDMSKFPNFRGYRGVWFFRRWGYISNFPKNSKMATRMADKMTPNSLYTHEKLI